MADIYKGQINMLEVRVKGNDDEHVVVTKKELKKTQGVLNEANEAIGDLQKFHDNVKKDWADPKQRVNGHIRPSPSMLVIKASPRTGLRSSLMVPSSEAHLWAISLIWACFEYLPQNCLVSCVILQLTNSL